MSAVTAGGTSGTWLVAGASMALASLGLALGRTGKAGIAGTAARETGLVVFVGVAPGVSETASLVCSPGSASAAAVWEPVVVLGVGVAGVEGTGGSAATSSLAFGSVSVSTPACWLAGSSTPLVAVVNILFLLFDLAILGGKGRSGRESHGSWRP